MHGLCRDARHAVRILAVTPGLTLTAILTLALAIGANVAIFSISGSEVLQSAVVSSGFFSTLAGPFAAGRPLEASDYERPAAVISERLAQRLFGAPATAIGEQLSLTRGMFTVIAVAGRGFQFPLRLHPPQSRCSKDANEPKQNAAVESLCASRCEMK